jgi:hypothetical protein
VETCPKATADPAVDAYLDRVDDEDVVRSILDMTAATSGPIC